MQKILFVREDYQIVETTMLRHIQDKKNLARQDYKSPSLIVVELFTFSAATGDGCSLKPSSRNSLHSPKPENSPAFARNQTR